MGSLRSPFATEVKSPTPLAAMATVEGAIAQADVEALRSLAPEAGTADIPDHMIQLPLVRLKVPLVIDSVVHGYHRKGYPRYTTPNTPGHDPDELLPYTVKKTRFTGDFDVSEYADGLFIAQAVLAAAQEASRDETHEVSAVGSIYSGEYHKGRLPLVSTILIDISSSTDTSTGFRFDG